MKRRWKIVLGTAAGLVVGGFVTWRIVRYSVLVSAAMTETLGAESWAIIRSHPDDPRTLAAATTELQSARWSEGCKPYDRLAQSAEPILAAHPTGDDSSLDAIASIVRSCPDRRALKWTSRPPRDLVVALKKDVTNNYTRKPELSLGALLAIAPVVDQNVVDILAASVRPQPTPVDDFIKRGIPPDGTKLEVNAPRVPPKSDPRLGHGLVAWISGVYGHIQEDEGASMLRLLDWITPPALDEHAAGRLASDLVVPQVMTLCKALVRPDTKAFITQGGSTPEAMECLGGLATLTEATKLLAGLADRNDFATGTIDEMKSGKAWVEEHAAALAAMGPRVVPALESGLTDERLSARTVAARAYAKIDRQAYGVAAARALRAGPPTMGFDAELAMGLAPDELAVYFAALRFDVDTSAHAAAALRKRVTPAVWVPPFFANLLVDSSFTKQTVDRFAWLLTDTDGVAPPVADVLEKELAASGGKPEPIYWLKKMLALRALEAKGTSRELETAKKFLRDGSEYEEVEKTENDRGEVLSDKRLKRNIAGLASAAVAAMANR